MNSKAKHLPANKTVYILGHAGECQEGDGACSWTTYEGLVTKAIPELKSQHLHVAQSTNKSHRHGEIRDMLGPSSRKGKRAQNSKEHFTILTCGTLENLSYTRTFGRCRTAELLHAGGFRKGYTKEHHHQLHKN